MSKKLKTATKRNQLPGWDLTTHFNKAKKQTKELLNKSKQSISKAKLAEQTHNKKLKSAQDAFNKHHSSHKSSPTKSSAKNLNSSKTKLSQAQQLHSKSKDTHVKAKDQHQGYQDHYNKLDHLHKSLSAAEKNWTTPQSAGRNSKEKTKFK